jgi:5-methylcytosine-specific restriction protein A
MRDQLAYVGANYPAAISEPFGGHPLAQFIRSNLSAAIAEGLRPDQSGLIIDGSAGAGNWAEVPWVAVFDPRVTGSATKGYYVVYLFSIPRQCVYLSLNQGTTAVIQEFKQAGFGKLKERAALIRDRVSEYAGTFPLSEIDLGSDRPLPKGYEAGHAIGKRYDLNNLPAESALREDLELLIDAYLRLTFRGGTDWTVEESDEEKDLDDDKKTLIEKRQYRMHRRIERNPKASRDAKRHHGFTCKACGMDFSTKYGPLGKGYIEAHHLRPLASLAEGESAAYNVKTDFTVLCANCHRMIHRTDNPADLTMFASLVVK